MSTKPSNDNSSKMAQISLCHMACQIGNAVAGVEEVTFLYRLTTGACPKSYGVNVARLAGLPESVQLRAAAKSREFEAVYGKHTKRSKDDSPMLSCADTTVGLIKELIGLASNAIA